MKFAEFLFVVAGGAVVGFNLGVPAGKIVLANEICEARGLTYEDINGERTCVDVKAKAFTPLINKSGQPANPT